MASQFSRDTNCFPLLFRLKMMKPVVLLDLNQKVSLIAVQGKVNKNTDWIDQKETLIGSQLWWNWEGIDFNFGIGAHGGWKQ